MNKATHAALALVAGCCLALPALAQDTLVSDLFPGAHLSGHIPGADTPLYAAAYAEFEHDARQYVALTAYQPYATDVRERPLSYALLEHVEGRYEVRLDHFAGGDATTFDIGTPFKYRVEGAELVVFSMCYRGCRYAFFRLGGAPIEIPVEPYTQLAADEQFGRGDVYHFDEEGLSASFNVARTGDHSCCPSGGTLDVSYRLRNDRFEIADAVRNNQPR